MANRLFNDPEALADLCCRHHIRRLSMFGSVLKGPIGPTATWTSWLNSSLTRSRIFSMAGIEMELSALLGGREADLCTAGDLSRYLRDKVVREAEVQYEPA